MNTSPPLKTIEISSGVASSGTDDSMSITSDQSITTEEIKAGFRLREKRLHALEERFDDLSFDELVFLGAERLAQRWILEFQRRADAAAAGQDKQQD